MKKYVSILLAGILILVFLCSCSKKDETLMVYVVQSEALYTASLEAYMSEYPEVKLEVITFESYEEMQDRLSTELMSGEGPDVLLFNSLYSAEDPYKLAVGNTLLALDEQVEELSDDAYYCEILDAGVMDGHQYFIPISWNFLQAYSMAGTIVERGYDELYTAIMTEAEALKGDESVGVSSLQIHRADIMSFFSQTMGYELMDAETGTFVDRKTEFEKAANFVKVFYDNMEKTRTIANKYRNDFAGAVSHFTYLVEDFAFMNNLRYYQSVYPDFVGEEMYFAPFTRWESETLTAQVIQYGAINRNAENAQGAWELLRYLLDVPADMNFSKYETQNVYYAPVNKVVYEACVNQLKSEYGPGPKRRVAPLNEDNTQLLMDIPERIDGSVIPNASLGVLVQECMEPYLLGEDIFDNCYKTLVQRMELYLSE